MISFNRLTDFKYVVIYSGQFIYKRYGAGKYVAILGNLYLREGKFHNGLSHGTFCFWNCA